MKDGRASSILTKIARRKFTLYTKSMRISACISVCTCLPIIPCEKKLNKIQEMKNKINKHRETCRQRGRGEKRDLSYSCTVMPYYFRFFKTALHLPKQFVSISVTRQTTSAYCRYMLQPRLHFHLNT